MKGLDYKDVFRQWQIITVFALQDKAVGQAKLDQINHKMHYVMTGERTAEHEAWVKE